MVDDQEIVGAEGLGQRVRLARKLPDVVGVGEAGEVGELRGAMLGVRRRWCRRSPVGRSGTCPAWSRRRWGLGSGPAVPPHARGLHVRSWSDVPTVGDSLGPQGQHRPLGGRTPAPPAAASCELRCWCLWLPPHQWLSPKYPAAWSWRRERCEHGRPGLRPCLTPASASPVGSGVSSLRGVASPPPPPVGWFNFMVVQCRLWASAAASRAVASTAAPFGITTVDTSPVSFSRSMLRELALSLASVDEASGPPPP